MKKLLLTAMLLISLVTYVDAQDWNQIIKAVASDRAASDYFGYSVSISGDYAIVGAYYEDEDTSGANTLTNAGSAYIFMRSGTSWSQQQKIVASDRAVGDYFGYSVSISGDYAVVGAYGEDEDTSGANTKSYAGSAYIFASSSATSVELENFTSTEIPCGFSLGQNYPNPFNPSTTFHIALPSAGTVKLVVLNMLGQEVAEVVNKHLAAGTYDFSWNAKNLSSGIYFYKLTTNQFSAVRKMTLLK